MQLTLIEKVLPDDWGRNLVWRFRVDPLLPALPETVIVKRSRLGGGHIFNEWVSLEFLNQFAPLRALVPEFYGGDEELELLVLEDLGNVRGTDDLGTILEGKDPARARNALLASARKMALLHTVTAGSEETFQALRRQFPSSDRPIAKDQFAHLFSWFAQFHSRFDLAVSLAQKEEVEAIIAKVMNPEAPRAYTRGDVCPSNIAYTDDKIRFYDFEMGAFRHVFLSAAYFRLFHLSCFNGNLIPQALQAELEATYFQGVTALIDNPAHYRADMAAAGAAMLVWMLNVMLEKALQKDRARHLASSRQRIFAALTLFVNHRTFAAPFPHMTKTFNALREKLDDQWTEEEKGIALFPAFRQR